MRNTFQGNDWNHNGKYDAHDSYVDYQLSQGGSNGSGGGGNSGCSVSLVSFVVVFVIALLLATVNEILGAVVLLGWLYYSVFLK